MPCSHRASLLAAWQARSASLLMPCKKRNTGTHSKITPKITLYAPPKRDYISTYKYINLIY
jgi:hypothetical protein